jgi:cell division protein YceG involved in septum cleavage
LYFVLVDKSGDMAFSTTYAQQLAQEAIAAKAGV